LHFIENLFPKNSGSLSKKTYLHDHLFKENYSQTFEEDIKSNFDVLREILLKNIGICINQMQIKEEVDQMFIGDSYEKSWIYRVMRQCLNISINELAFLRDFNQRIQDKMEECEKFGFDKAKE